MTSIFTVVKGQQKHRYTRSTNARLSKNILVTVRNALFRIKTYTTSAFPKIPVTNITIKMIGTTRSAMMLFSVFIVDQCSKDKLKCPKKEAFWFIPACSPDITQEMLLVLYWLSVLPRALAATSLTSVITWDFNKRKSRVLSAGKHWFMNSYLFLYKIDSHAGNCLICWQTNSNVDMKFLSLHSFWKHFLYSEQVRFEKKIPKRLEWTTLCHKRGSVSVFYILPTLFL